MCLMRSFFRTAFGPQCHQIFEGPVEPFIPPDANRELSEDCLQLNIYVPGSVEKAKYVEQLNIALFQSKERRASAVRLRLYWSLYIDEKSCRHAAQMAHQI